MSKITNTINEVVDSTSTATDHLDNTITYVYNYEQLITGIEDYYSAKSSDDSEAIAEAQVQIFSSLFSFGTIIPDEWGGWIADIYNDVFNISVDIVGKEAEKNRILARMNKLAPYVSNIDYYKEYCYYDSILNNFDEYYEKKKALKECLTAPDAATAIELFYASYENSKDPFGDFFNHWCEFWKERGNDLYNIFNFDNWKIGMKKIEHDFNNLFRNNMQSCVSQINTASKANVDPLILDLDGDGYNIETKENGSYFDLDGNGYAERINWTKKDGFLCLDLNENGSIDSGAELFGDNYYGIIIREDYENYISEIVSKYFDEHKIYVLFKTSGFGNALYMSDELDKKTTLNEFLKFQKDKTTHHSRNTANVDIFLPRQYDMVDKDSVVAKIKSFSNELKNEFCYIKVDFLVFEKDSKYSYKSLTLNNYLDWKDPNNWNYKPKRICFRLNHNSELSYFIIHEDFFKEET